MGLQRSSRVEFLVTLIALEVLGPLQLIVLLALMNTIRHPKKTTLNSYCPLELDPALLLFGRALVKLRLAECNQFLIAHNIQQSSP